MPAKKEDKKEEIVFDQSKLAVVAIGEVRPNTWNPKEHGTQEFQRIKKGLQQHGLRLPIVVRENEGYEIVDGEQRWRAAQELRYVNIPIYNEGKLSDQKAKELTIIYEQQVPFDDMQFGKLLAEMSELYDSIAIPYSGEEVKDFVETWEAFDTFTKEAMSNGQIGVDKGTEIEKELEAGVQDTKEVQHVRPVFENIADAQPTEGSKKDRNWFYVEYYGDDVLYEELSTLLEGQFVGKSPHEISPAIFAEMVQSRFRKSKK